MQEILEKADTLRILLSRAVEEDAAAFESLMQALHLPKTTPPEQQARTQAVERATRHAADVPFETAQRAVAVMALALQAASLGNLNAICDAGTAVALARAALTGAGLNVRTNTLSLLDQAAAGSLVAGIRELEAQAAGLEAELKKVLNDRGGIHS